MLYIIYYIFYILYIYVEYLRKNTKIVNKIFPWVNIS